jgi:hypothetical protein
MIEEFRKGFRECLTGEQRATWEAYESGEGAQAMDQLIRNLTGGNEAKQETQFIRITNNAFTAEHGWYNGQTTSSETVQRGGVGAYHGEAQIRFKNAALNARNPFAENKPPYKERQLDFNFSGPVIRNRLTMSVNANQNESQNVGTVHAITLDGPFDMGIVNPYLGRSVGADGTLQLSQKNSVLFGLSYGINRRSNQGVGGYTLPDRASTGREHFLDLWGKLVTVFSSRTLYETNFEAWREHNENTPLTNAVSIDVLGAFSSGGAQNTNLNDFRTTASVTSFHKREPSSPGEPAYRSISSRAGLFLRILFWVTLRFRILTPIRPVRLRRSGSIAAILYSSTTRLKHRPSRRGISE